MTFRPLKGAKEFSIYVVRKCNFSIRLEAFSAYIIQNGFTGCQSRNCVGFLRFDLTLLRPCSQMKFNKELHFFCELGLTVRGRNIRIHHMSAEYYELLSWLSFLILLKCIVFYYSGGKFISIGEKIRLPDDVTMGYIIGKLFWHLLLSSSSLSCRTHMYIQGS